MWAKIKQKLWEKRGIVLIAPSVAGFVILIRVFGLLQLLELSIFDQLFRFRPLEKRDPRIVIVGIGESDIEKVGTWPIPDNVLAELLTKIKEQKPKVIGLDIYRDLPVEPGYPELVKVFKSTPNLIGIRKVVGTGQDQSVAPSPVLDELGQVASNDFPLDIDAKIRRGFIYLNDSEGKTVFSLAFKTALKYLEDQQIKPKMLNDIHIQLGKVVFSPLKPNDGAYVRTSAEGYQVLVNYRGPQYTFPIISLTEILENKVEPTVMRDKIVLIGSTAKSLKDFFFIPYSGNIVAIPEPMAGVEIHANLASQIISSALEGRPSLKSLDEPLEWLWILVWSFAGSTFTCKWRLKDNQPKISFSQTTLRIIIFSGCIIGATYISFLGSWWIPSLPALIALVGATIVQTGYTLWSNLKLSYKQIEEYSHTLEIKVEQRTLELKQKNEQLDQAFQQLKAAQKQMVAQEKLAFLGNLTAGIAHEIRNPLNFVKNFATISVDLTEELKEEIDNQAEDLEAEAVDYIHEIFGELKDSIVEIEKQGQRIEVIITGMMMHAQKDAGQQEWIDLNSVVVESVQLAYKSFLSHKNAFEIKIETDYDESLGEFAIVPQEVSRAIVNIINNACYTVNMKKKLLGDDFVPTILVKTINLGEVAEISIRDNGQGMTPDVLEQVFNPFFTTKPTGEGTGLGLSLTHEIIVGQHQGEIKVDSYPDTYTEFIIRLPRKLETIK